MKRIVFAFIFFFFALQNVFADVEIYSKNNKFGLKEGAKYITEASYKKLVKLGNTAWIMQEGSKFGIMHDSGKVILKPQYNRAERVLGKYVKFAKGDKYGIFDEMGFEILPVEYSSIDLLVSLSLIFIDNEYISLIIVS